MNIRIHTAWRRLLPTIVVALAACSAAPPKAVPARATLSVSQDANPDANGRASPIVLRVYQLQEEGTFKDVDFFALFEHEREVLGPSLLSREEYALAPGEQRELQLRLAPGVRYIGAAAAFRDIDNARWRAISAAPKKSLTDILGKDHVTVRVERASVGILIGD